MPTNVFPDATTRIRRGLRCLFALATFSLALAPSLTVQPAMSVYASVEKPAVSSAAVKPGVVMDGLSQFTPTVARLAAPNASGPTPSFARGAGTVTFSAGENVVGSAIIDTANGFGYFATSNGVREYIVKVNLRTMTRVVSMTLSAGESNINTALFDATNQYGYFATSTAPARIIKIDLARFIRVGALTLNTGEDYVASGVIDTAGGFAYFGTSTAPGIVVKVNLNGINTPTRTGAIALNAATREDYLQAAVIDEANSNMYFAAINSDATGSDSIVRVSLASFTRTAALVLNTGEVNVTVGVIDTAGNAAYFATSSTPINVVKVQLSTLTEVATAIQPFDGTQSQVYAAAIDPAHNHAFFATYSQPGMVAQVNLSTFSSVQPISLNSGEDMIGAFVLDPDNRLGYAGTGTTPGMVVPVRLANNVLTVTSSLTQTLVGQSVTITGALSAVDMPITPTGNLTFTINPASVYVTALNNGIASYTTSGLSIGVHPITVTYGGDATFDAISSVITITILDKYVSTSALTTTLSTSTYGQVVTLTASISTTAPGVGVPAGNVTFTIDNNVAAVTTLSGGIARLVTSTLAVGTHPVTMTYGGSATFHGSTASLSGAQNVVRAANNITVTTSQSSIVTGLPVTFTTVVRPASIAITPTGNLTYSFDSGVVAVVALSNGVAQYITSPVALGVHTVTATYGGDVFFDANSAVVTQTVIDRYVTTASVSSSLNPSKYNQVVTFTASLTTTTQGVGAPTGSVTFTIDDATVAVTALNNGVARIVTNTLLVGTHSVSVTYDGTPLFYGSQGALSGGQVVNKADSSMNVASSQSEIVTGQPVTITAVVSPVGLSITPTGNLTFTIDDALPVVIALDNGVARYVTQEVALGTHFITATYDGDAFFAASTGAITETVIDKYVTSITVTSTTNPSVHGQAVTLTAAITTSTPGVGMPMGSVTFTLDDNVVAVTTFSNGIARLVTNTLDVGTHTFTVTYDETAFFHASTGALAGGQIVNKANSTMSVASSHAQSLIGSPITFTAYVTVAAPGVVALSGAVTFTVDGVDLGASTLNSGVATITTADLPAGTHAITATYDGNNWVNGSSAQLASTVVVTKVGTVLTMTKTATQLMLGHVITIDVALTTPSIFMLMPVGGSGLPSATGVISITLDSVVVATPELVSGAASYVTDTLTVGTHTLGAQYSGDAYYSGSSVTSSSSVVVIKPVIYMPLALK